MRTYIKKTDGFGREYIEMTTEDGTVCFVPVDGGNSDYQRYLRWLEDPTAEEGGTLS